MFYEKLLEIGFSSVEAKIYIDLLRIGPQAISTIAKRICRNRSTIYSLIRSLGIKGVVSSFRRGKTKLYAANDPNCLVGYIDRKCRLYDSHKKELLSAIPEFRHQSLSCNYSKPIVSYFEGKEAIDQLFYEICSYSGKIVQFFRDKNGNISIVRNPKREISVNQYLISVYDDKISIINKNGVNQYAIVIKSKEMAEFHKNIFNIAQKGFNIGTDES